MSQPPLPDDRVLPHPERCDPARSDYAEIVRRHAEAMAVGRPWYLDPRTGYQVWTAQTLWERGECCDTGCRHCPYLAR